MPLLCPYDSVVVFLYMIMIYVVRVDCGSNTSLVYELQRC